MRLSSISKQAGAGADSLFARLLGENLRRLRIARGLTQAELGRPMTRSYVSAVELGRTLPSLGALGLMAAKLGMPVGTILGEVEKSVVNIDWPAVYTRGHEDPEGPHPTA